ncbi:SRPBCC family protein [Leptolyngbya sp. PCC 6406]|uniref:SRPBCC family protein n=1 Tax=Leptolyngbya sp. PCC 6406 TaxID=1173264 RepID=UPI0002ACF23A|nr:SRPBCC family protein [Leptolyngbya sp. PCC 6406]
MDAAMVQFPQSSTTPDPIQAAAVEVTTEKLEGRNRRIRARITVPCSLEQVWQVLTDYDGLADFIPNLALSRRIDHPTQGIRLEQVGAQCFLNIKFCARVVLDMVEQFPHQLSFQMVEGDFKRFQGCWSLEAVDSPEGMMTQLAYEVTLLPPRAIPGTLIERHLCQHLTQNLQAIRHQAMVVCGA